MTNRFRRFALLTTVLVASPFAAQAQDTTQARLERVETALRDLQGIVYSVESPQDLPPIQGLPTAQASSASSALSVQPVNGADVAVRLSAIEGALAQLTGRVEEVTYRIEQQGRRLDALEGASVPDYGAPLELPALGVEQNAAPVLDAGPTDLIAGAIPPVQEAPSVVLPDDSALAFDQAYQAVLGADYQGAEETLEEFVEKFPDAPETPEAKFLLGEIYLATGANSDAARIFLDHVRTYEGDPRAPEAYLKLGVAFGRLEMTNEACGVFRQGQTQYPDVDARLAARYADEQRTFGC